MPVAELAERPCTRCRQDFQPKRSTQWICDPCRERLKEEPANYQPSIGAMLADRLRARKRS